MGEKMATEIQFFAFSKRGKTFGCCTSSSCGAAVAVAAKRELRCLCSARASLWAGQVAVRDGWKGGRAGKQKVATRRVACARPPKGGQKGHLRSTFRKMAKTVTKRSFSYVSWRQKCHFSVSEHLLRCRAPLAPFAHFEHLLRILRIWAPFAFWPPLGGAWDHFPMNLDSKLSRTTFDWCLELKSAEIS